jgi:Tol biopolymer transport system component
VEFWDPATGKEKPLPLKTKGILTPRALALSADGKTLAVGGLGTRSLPSYGTLSKGLGEAGQFATKFQAYLSQLKLDGVITLWDFNSGKEKQQLACPAWVNAIAFGPSETLAGGCQDASIALWDLRKGAEPTQLKGHTDPVTAVAFSPDGRTLASSSEDRSLVLWDLAGKRGKATLFGHSAPVMSLAYAPDGKAVASGDTSSEIFVWKASDLPAPIMLRGDSNTGLTQVTLLGR